MTAKDLNFHIEAIKQKTWLKYIDGDKGVLVTDWPIEAQMFVVKVWNTENCLSKISEFIGKSVSLLYENIQTVFYTETPKPNCELWETKADWSSGKILESKFIKCLGSDYKPSLSI